MQCGFEEGLLGSLKDKETDRRMAQNTWYSIVGVGRDPRPAHGPFNSLEKAEAAVESFRYRYDYKAEGFLTSGSVRIMGPFATWKKARDADVSRGPVAKSY